MSQDGSDCNACSYNSSARHNTDVYTCYVREYAPALEICAHALYRVFRKMVAISLTTVGPATVDPRPAQYGSR